MRVMDITYAKSETAQTALRLVRDLQSYFAKQLDLACQCDSTKTGFQAIQWSRDQGAHGGGERLVAKNQKFFDRAAINVSQVQYDDLPDKPLGAATALSTIVHPANPHAPSMHMHISWTEMKSGKGYWRIMADLNPAILSEKFKSAFDECLKAISGRFYDEGSAQGDKYFYIPAIKRHRGVAHFYLEGHNTGDALADINFAKSFGMTVIDCYTDIVSEVFKNNPAVSEADKKTQLAYHTLYLFQVLSLDRGTTSGLLVHNQNDVGIMGSIPSKIDKDLLLSWKTLVPDPQKVLIQALVDVFKSPTPCPVEEDQKILLAQVVRNHYQKHPEALKLQASGNSLPPTVVNHK